MSLETRIERLESKHGSVIRLVVVPPDRTTEEAAKRAGITDADDNVVYVSTGVLRSTDSQE